MKTSPLCQQHELQDIRSPVAARYEPSNPDWTISGERRRRGAPGPPHTGRRAPLTDLIRKHLSAEDARALSFGLKINIYGLGLMALWNTVNSVILQLRVEATAPESLKGTALGLVGLLGVGTAALVQPFAGRASDATALPDRRRPFIVGRHDRRDAQLARLWLGPDLRLLLVAGTCWLQISTQYCPGRLSGLHTRISSAIATRASLPGARTC